MGDVDEDNAELALECLEFGADAEEGIEVTAIGPNRDAEVDAVDGTGTGAFGQGDEFDGAHAVSRGVCRRESVT